MAYGDPVLQRSMFRGPSTSALQPSVGFGSTTSADENAQALRNMFSPTVSINEPAEMIQQEQQPIQSFQEGGMVYDMSGIGGGGAAFPGGAAEVIAPSPTPSSGGVMDLLSRPFRALSGQPIFRRPEETAPAPAAAPAAPPQTAAPSPAPTGSMASFIGGPTPGAPGLASASPPAPERAAPERQKGALELTLEGIRAERARSADDKRQNALLALMQAGLAMAAGRSPNALSNIAAGGQAGIGAFAAMEKDRRAEQTALRREETALLMERERMRAQEERAPEAIRTYAMLGGWNPASGREGFDEAVRKGIQVSKSLEREPETVRLFQALGGGDLMKGFEIYNGDKKLQAAQAILKDISASEEDKKAANEYIRGQLARARTGAGSFAGFSATPVR